ncbi:MAG TPA: hypothetical protein VL947_12185, partial [Cytophagales bacterium]|nr:hypothetical protein [Cytophagales bacterium]
MKTIFKFLLFVLTLTTPYFLWSRPETNVKESNFPYEKRFKKVLESHAKVISKVIYFSDHVGDLDKNPSQIIVRKSALEDEINNEITRLKSIEGLCDKELLDSVVMYYDTLRKSIASEYDVAINLRMNMDYSHSHVHSFLLFLDKADQNIMHAEDFLYNMELRYANKHDFKLPEEEEHIRQNILKNDAVIKYHNKVFLEFYKVYTLENEYLKLSAIKKDTSLSKYRKDFAVDLFYAEEMIAKNISFEGDASLTTAIKLYFHYLRGEYFKHLDFYNAYLKKVEEKHGKNHVDAKKHEQTLRIAQSKLVSPQHKDHEELVKGLTQRDQLLQKVEQSSFRFLYDHSP